MDQCIVTLDAVIDKLVSTDKDFHSATEVTSLVLAKAISKA